MAKQDPEGPVDQKPFSVSYETLVKAFIGCLIALMVWSYNEISSLRQNKADKAEVYREIATIRDSVGAIRESVTRVENIYLKVQKIP